jgi:hypothetical protein
LELHKAARHRKFRTAEELGAVIGQWELIRYDISGCRYVSSISFLFFQHIFVVVMILTALQFLMPWKQLTTYLLYVLDMEREKLIVIDTKPLPKYAKDVPLQHYCISIVGFHLELRSAISKVKPNSWVDVQKWRFERKCGISEDPDG